MLKTMLDERNLPKLKSRKQMIDLLLENEYGVLPSIPYEMSISEPKILEKRYSGGLCTHSTVDVTITTSLGSHTFKVDRVLHNDNQTHPFFVSLNFESAMPYKYCPLEEVSDRGFSILSFCYKDVTSDNKDFNDGLAKVLLANGQDTPSTAGKIMIWAFAAMRVLDYAYTLQGLDYNLCAVVGHSRLGKTALVTGMLDERFKFVFSNNSGCSGAALSRGNSGVVNKKEGTLNDSCYYRYGENISDITTVFPHQFCKKYQSFTKNNFADDFDQHYLLATIAPRHLYVSSASKDSWADPTSEFLNCVASSKAYEDLGLEGLIHDNRLPQVGERFIQGRIGYHLRFGPHFLSRLDWNNFMDYITLHKND